MLCEGELTVMGKSNCNIGAALRY